MAVHGIAHLYISTFGRGQAMCCHIDITLYSSQCNNCILRAWKSILNNATGNTGRRTVQHGVKSSLRYISQDTAAHHWMAPAIQYLQVLWIVSSEHSELSVYYYRDVRMKHLLRGKGRYGIKGCGGEQWVTRPEMAWQPTKSGVSRALRWRRPLSSPRCHSRIGSRPPRFPPTHCLREDLSRPPVRQQYAFPCISIWLVSKGLWLTGRCPRGTSSEPCAQKALCPSWSKAGS